MKRALIAIALIAVIAVAGIYFIQEAQLRQRQIRRPRGHKRKYPEKFRHRAGHANSAGRSPRDSHPGPDQYAHADSGANDRHQLSRFLNCPKYGNLPGICSKRRRNRGTAVNHPQPCWATRNSRDFLNLKHILPEKSSAELSTRLRIRSRALRVRMMRIG